MPLSILDFIVYSVLFVLFSIVALFILFIVGILFTEVWEFFYRIIYLRKYKVFNDAPAFSFKHQHKNDLLHHLHITPYKAVFLIGIDYVCIDDSGYAHRRKTHWKDRFVTYKEAELELFRRYELWQASPQDFPQDEYPVGLA